MHVKIKLCLTDVFSDNNKYYYRACDSSKRGFYIPKAIFMRLYSIS